MLTAISIGGFVITACVALLFMVIAIQYCTWYRQQRGFAERWENQSAKWQATYNSYRDRAERLRTSDAMTIAALQQQVRELQSKQIAWNPPHRITTYADFAALRELVEAGRRDLAKRYHPDRGGDARKMQTVNAVADTVLGALGK